MNVAYIVAAHRDLRQLERLLRRLAGEGTPVVVHVDTQVSQDEYASFRRRAEDLDVHHLDRHRGFWGGFGVVRAALKGIRHLVDTGTRFDYAALLSGQDYPLVSRAALQVELQRAERRSFMTHFRLPFEGWGSRGGLDRVERWHLVSHVALHVRLPWKRQIPGGLTPYGGGRPWVLEREAVRYIDDFVRAEPSFVRFFEHVLHPDELFFQTILLNSPLAATIVDDHRQYVKWRGGASPAILTIADLDDLLASRCLFARKFDYAVDEDILDRLDEQLEVACDVAAR
jgi:hypothetical protein